ncbi:MAG: rod shape-determining protein MreD [Rhodospirillales bacterium]|nr:rod shape-determining protein MreD [Rhodospirillales bacterium]
MIRSVWLRLGAAARTLVPAGLTFLLALAGSVPLSAIDLQIIRPLLPFAAVYYWALYRPDLLPAPVAFSLGLLVDILGGAPLGVHAAVFCLVHGGLRRQRRFLVGKSFMINWSGFALVAAGALALVWLLASILHGAPLSAEALLMQAATTIAAFPLAFRLLLRCHSALTPPA